MTPLEKALDFIGHWEGGFVDNPDDPGGATHFGISFRFLKTLAPELADIDRNGDIDVDDIRAMTPKKARKIYTVVFWNSLQMNCLPGNLAVAVMDTAVNMGKFRAVRLLQRAFNRHWPHKLEEDGVMGIKTIYAMNNCLPECLVIRQFLLLRVFEYKALCAENPKLRDFLVGWLNRVEALEAIL